MIDVIVDTIIDNLKLLLFLFLAFLIIELIEHKFSGKTKRIISKSGRFGPLLGGMLGLFPQCGFSVMATNLFVTRIISLGTLIAIYLTTSDEMLPVLLSHNAEISIIIKILAIKLFIGIISGFIIDFILRKKENKMKTDYHLCNEDECHCDKGIFQSALIHTMKTFIFIFIVSFLLNVLMHYFGDEYLANIFLKNTFFAPFVTSLVGLIPNCGASVMLTELYLEGAISLSGVISGLLTGSGVALVVLFKSNKNLKENIIIVSLIYGIGVISGIIIQLLGIA